LVVYHIEAIPGLFEELNRLCSRFADQVALCACLADEVGNTLAFPLAGSDGHRAPSHGGLGAALPLSTTTLDHLIESGQISQPPDHLVIEVQGAELLVLRGSTKTLHAGSVRTITVETSAEPRSVQAASFQQIFGFLANYGYYLRKAEFNQYGWVDAEFSLPWWPRANSGLDPVPLGLNVAIGADCVQSSTSPWSVHEDEARYVLEARRNGGYAFHTLEEERPWLLIDLLSPYYVSEIIVFNRINDGPDIAARAKSLMVSVSLDGYEWSILHRSQEVFGGIDGRPLRVPCANRSLRYVRLQLTALQVLPLHLDSVEIYGHD
jgi:FkbM family methyltransferase